MKSKKGIVILSSVVAVCAAGLILSHFIDWPVDYDNAGGNISKSSRFSRKTTTESISNMEELILNDPNYKNGIVSAYTIMQTRAQQFGVLVDMSNDVAGEIPEFEGVLDEMNKVYVTVSNVCASLLRAGENINATLNGEKRPDLAQNTINASLAYTTLQKQNKLANEFIDVTDKYVEKAEADDRLLFVRDQWVDYQLLTAALEGDKESAAELEKKGSLLAAGKTVATLGSFDSAQQLVIMHSGCVSHNFGIETSLSHSVPEEVISSFTDAMFSARPAFFSQTHENLSESIDVTTFNQQFTGEVAKNLQSYDGATDFINNIGWDVTGFAGGVNTVKSGATGEVSGVIANVNTVGHAVTDVTALMSEAGAEGKIISNIFDSISYATVNSIFSEASAVFQAGQTGNLIGQCEDIIQSMTVGALPAANTISFANDDNR